MSLVLGSIEFSVDELPDKIRLGGTQAVAVHKYPGGAIDIQTLGAFDDAISWEGILWFQGAMARMQALLEMRTAGKPVLLQIGDMSCQVVITRFQPTYENDYHIPYVIELQPAELLKALKAANVAQAQISTPVAAPAVAVAPQVASSPAALAASPATPATYSISRLFGLGASTPLGSIINQMAPAGIGQIMNTVSQVAHLVSVGETLWSIATRHYGDGSLWTQIVAANNLASPLVNAGLKLIIPNPTRVVK